VHALLKMYVLEMDGLPRLAEDRGRTRIVVLIGDSATEFRGCDVLDGPAEGVEEVALPVAFEDGAIEPTVTMIVSELDVLERLVQLAIGVARLNKKIVGRDALRVFEVRPQTAHRRAFGVAVVLVLLN